MLSRYRVGLFVASILTAGLFFLASPESSYAGSTFGGPPCCDLPSIGFCEGGDDAAIICNRPECLNEGDCIFYEDRICVPDDGSVAFGSCQVLQSNIPTLGEWGLMALAVVLGVAGFMVIRRRKAAA
jgi:hypothetical protein